MTIRKIINKLVFMMQVKNEEMRKFGGTSIIIQLDETMLNYKCKSYRERSSKNHADILVINEKGGNVRKIYAEVSRKEGREKVVIKCERVLAGSGIHTDEHLFYLAL